MQDFVTEEIAVYTIVVVTRRTDKALCSDGSIRDDGIRSRMRFFQRWKWSLTAIAMRRAYVSSN